MDCPHFIFSSSRLPSVDVRVMKALEYIRRNACSGITPPDVVREMGCSRRLADLRFTEAMGHTILDEIHAVRIERVKELLRKPGQETSAIPALCGYGSLADLCRDFKKRTGKTLHGWRMVMSRFAARNEPRNRPKYVARRVASIGFN